MSEEKTYSEEALIQYLQLYDSLVDTYHRIQEFDDLVERAHALDSQAFKMVIAMAARGMSRAAPSFTDVYRTTVPIQIQEQMRVKPDDVERMIARFKEESKILLEGMGEEGGSGE